MLSYRILSTRITKITFEEKNMKTQHLLIALILSATSVLTGAIQSQLVIPHDVNESLLKTYSQDEKNLINEDFKNIKTLCFRNTTPATEQPLYVATAGGPGACKSTVLETYLQGKPNFVYADPDQRSLKFMMNTYHQSLTQYHVSASKNYNDLQKSAYDKWRGGSNYIANTILNDAFDKGYNVAHGTTLTGPTIEPFLKKVKAKGYKIILLLCFAPDEERVKAVTSQANRGFLQADPQDVINKGKVFPERFPIYFEYADEIQLYWMDDSTKGSCYAATWTNDGKLVVENQAAFDAFTQQYNRARSGKTLLSLDELMRI